MKTITLGKTGIVTPQNAFGALPIQRIDTASAVKLLHRAYEGGMNFFDTARAYSDSEVKMGEAFRGMFDQESEMTDEVRAFIDEDRRKLSGDFCRGCGYCSPCSVVRTRYSGSSTQELFGL